jgi:hypothetical protein
MAREFVSIVKHYCERSEQSFSRGRTGEQTKPNFRLANLGSFDIRSCMSPMPLDSSSIPSKVWDRVDKLLFNKYIQKKRNIHPGVLVLAG